MQIVHWWSWKQLPLPGSRLELHDLHQALHFPDTSQVSRHKRTYELTYITAVYARSREVTVIYSQLCCWVHCISLTTWITILQLNDSFMSCACSMELICWWPSVSVTGHTDSCRRGNIRHGTLLRRVASDSSHGKCAWRRANKAPSFLDADSRLYQVVSLLAGQAVLCSDILWTGPV
jgi:hypothetical protein